MILEQKKGPFSKNSSFRVGGSDARAYMHLGIHMPKCEPITNIKENAADPDIQIETANGVHNYKINATGILEFDANVGNSVKITFLKDLPAECIIDLIYKPEGE